MSFERAWRSARRLPLAQRAGWLQRRPPRDARRFGEGRDARKQRQRILRKAVCASKFG